MMEKTDRYLYPNTDQPEDYVGWPLYGSGLQNLGREGKPVRMKLRKIRDDELLMRIDAVSLCYTDVKEIDQGQSHPRLTYRDLSKNPIVPGHEVSLTVIQVGASLKGLYTTGDRFTIQPDVWVNGKSVPFSFGMDGGYRQYTIVGKDILEGDGGNYLLPIPKEMSYAASAITEPWACVEAAYRMSYRSAPKENSSMLFLGSSMTRDGYQFQVLFESGNVPKLIYGVDLPDELKGRLSDYCRRNGITFIEKNKTDLFSSDMIFDDIILLDPLFEEFAQLDRFIGKDTLIAILSDQAYPAKIEIDLGKIHYDNVGIVGARSLKINEAYRGTRVRTDFKPGGIAWILGAGGPMGRMHLQRAIESSAGPRLIIASEITEDRLIALQGFYSPLAQKHGKKLWIVNPAAEPNDFSAGIEDVMAQGGVDDVEIMVAHPSAIDQAVIYLAKEGIVNAFAGLKRGTKAGIDPQVVYGEKQVRFIGHSGSNLDDQKAVLDRVISHQLKPELSVAAIGGLNQIPNGIKAMKECVYPGKIIIYPHVLDFPLTAINDLKNVLPRVYSAMGEDGIWNFEAEKAFLNERL